MSAVRGIEPRCVRAHRVGRMRFALAGGTGIVRRHVSEVARERGHDVIILARSEGVDLATGAGLTERLAGIDVVIDASNTNVQKRADAEAFFGAVTNHLLAAEQEAGVGHHIALSIVGIDDVPLGYYQGKRLQERLVVEGAVPWTSCGQRSSTSSPHRCSTSPGSARSRLVPRMLSQPIAAVEVAEALVDLAEAGPSGRVPDLAGPEPRQMVDLARQL